MTISKLYKKARMGLARPREVVRLGATSLKNPIVQRLLQVLGNALPWGRSGMAHSCRVVQSEAWS
jgi:hypothetical protein